MNRQDYSVVGISDEMDVQLVDYMGSDGLICKAARVSTLGAKSIDAKESAGLIDFLLRNRHGSPFEHGTMTFRISAPIFVWREFMRHRVGFSYNEQSGRYMELEPMFYVPGSDRPLRQIGKAGEYIFVQGDEEQKETVFTSLMESYTKAWDSYRDMLDMGVAKEVARMCLPVATYSTAYVTCNPRSLMSFLSLRTMAENSTYPSYPQEEIAMVADQLEALFRALFPHTWESFNKNGRVSP